MFNFLKKSEPEKGEKNIFGQRLTNLRKNKGLSRSDVAAAIGVTNVAMGNYENGNTYPVVKTLMELAQFYRVSVDYLLGLDYWPIRKEFYSYFEPLGAIPYDFEKWTGVLDYTFGLIVDITDVEEDGSNPYLHLNFEESDKALFNALFKDYELSFYLFELHLAQVLGVRFFPPKGLFARENEGLTVNLMITTNFEPESKPNPETEFGTETETIQSVVGNRKVWYLVGSANKNDRNVHLIESPGLEGIVEHWKGLSEEKRKNILMRYYDKIKNPEYKSDIFYK